MDPVGYDDDRDICYAHPNMQRLRASVHATLDWTRANGAQPGKGWLEAATGEWHPDQDCPSDDVSGWQAGWKPLALRATPIVVLSALAPGVDTVVAEAVVDYIGMHPGVDVLVRAPLGFPLSLSSEISTYNTPGKLKRLELVLADLKKLPGFDLDRDVFEVELAASLKGDAAADVKANDPRFGKARRHLRYRASGEYVATHSDLLLAVYDTHFDKANLDDLFESGAATIVESKRNGLSFNLLGVSNNFAWADNGPVLLLSMDRRKNPSPTGEQTPLQLLHPYDTWPPARRQEEDPPDLDAVLNEQKDIKSPAQLTPELHAVRQIVGPDLAPAIHEPTAMLRDWIARWHQSGDELFRRILGRQDDFNSQPEAGKEAEQLKSLIGAEVMADAEAARFANRFDHVARARRRVSHASNQLSGQRESLLKSLAILVFVVAFTFGAFEHWHDAAATHVSSLPQRMWFVHDKTAWIRCGLLTVSLASLAWSALRYYRYVKSGAEEQRYDYRAAGEALRVQFYWLITGTGRGAASDYMQRQRDELDWIRYVVSSLCIPVEISRREFAQLSPHAQYLLLEGAHEKWVVGQRNYFDEHGPEKDNEAHHFHERGWTFAAAGLISIILMLLAEASPRVKHWLLEHHCITPGVLAAIGLCLVAAGWQRKRSHGGRRGATRHRPPGFLSWVFGNLRAWGGAMVIAAAVLLLSVLIGAVSARFHHRLPDAENAWTILTGTSLLLAGLCVAWAERNFYSEEARIFRSMSNLYTCADRRLNDLLPRLKAADPKTPQAERFLEEIQDIFYQIGCEALNENAEWLIQHRARPLEPFMPS